MKTELDSFDVAYGDRLFEAQNTRCLTLFADLGFPVTEVGGYLDAMIVPGLRT